MFQHRPLNLTRAEIRLVKILPVESVRNPTLRCITKHVDLDEATFHALSYEWGPLSNRRIIYIDGRPHEVSRNLWRFLAHARNHTKFRQKWFWIDQLCIDQRSDFEKNHQVRQMGLIYSKAHTTIIWIDESKLESPHVLVNDEAHIQRLMYSTYWTRLWIIQEVVLSLRILVVTPFRTLPWECLTVCGNDRDITTGAYTSCFREILTHRQRIMHHGGNRNSFTLDWVDVSKISSEAHCLDARDRIYGLLGIVHSTVRIEPDYICSTQTIWARLVVAQLVRSREGSTKTLIDALPSLNSYPPADMAQQIKDLEIFWNNSFEILKLKSKQDVCNLLPAFLILSICCREHLERSGYSPSYDVFLIRRSFYHTVIEVFFWLARTHGASYTKGYWSFFERLCESIHLNFMFNLADFKEIVPRNAVDWLWVGNDADLPGFAEAQQIYQRRLSPHKATYPTRAACDLLQEFVRQFAQMETIVSILSPKSLEDVREVQSTMRISLSSYQIAESFRWNSQSLRFED